MNSNTYKLPGRSCRGLARKQELSTLLVTIGGIFQQKRLVGVFVDFAAMRGCQFSYLFLLMLSAADTFVAS